MSLMTHEALDLENQEADFDSFLLAKDWSNCQAVVDNLFEMNFREEAAHLGRKLLVAKMSIRPRKEMSRERADAIDSHIYGGSHA